MTDAFERPPSAAPSWATVLVDTQRARDEWRASAMRAHLMLAAAVRRAGGVLRIRPADLLGRSYSDSICETWEPETGDVLLSIVSNEILRPPPAKAKDAATDTINLGTAASFRARLIEALLARMAPHSQREIAEAYGCSEARISALKSGNINLSTVEKMLAAVEKVEARKRQQAWETALANHPGGASHAGS